MANLNTASTDEGSAKAQLSVPKEQRRSRGLLNALSKSNQNLGFSNERLNLNEIAFFVEQAIAILQDPETIAKKRSAVLILLGSLWVSRSTDDFADFKIMRRLKLPPNHEGIYVSGDELFWILHVPGPDVKGGKLSDKSPACKCKKFIKLKIPQTYKNLIMQHIEDRVARNSNKLFDNRSFPNRDYFQRLLRSIRDERNERLSLNRIADFLFWELASHPSSDVASALLITGVKTSQEITQASYTALKESWLQAIYDNVCDVLEIELGLKANNGLLAEHLRFKSLPVGDVYLGTPFRPERAAVQSLIASLRNEIKKFLKQPIWSTQDLIQHQRHYALYNWLMYSFSSGARPVDGPGFTPKKINLSNGVHVISDKDKAGRENTRMVWLWDKMRDQIENYYEHVDVLFDRLGYKVPSLIDHFKNHSPSEAVGHLFLIDDNDKVVYLTPARVEEVLKNDYNYEMPSNSHRHYLRSNLLERQCPVETIDAFLGHSKTGQETWTKFSSFSPAVFIDSLRKHLVPLLIEDGWRTLSGLTRENRR